MNETLGQFLKRARKQKSLTLRDVQDRIGISNAYLSQLENNKILCPSPSILDKLSKCYDVSYELLMKLAGYPTTEKELSPSFRIGSDFVNLTAEEKERVLEYIQFLKSRRR